MLKGMERIPTYYLSEKNSCINYFVTGTIDISRKEFLLGTYNYQNREKMIPTLSLIIDRV